MNGIVPNSGIIFDILLSFQGDWALTAEYEEEEHIRRVEFLKNIIPSKRARFKVLSQSYQVGVISVMHLEHFMY